MKRRKRIITFSIILLVLLLGFGIFYIFTKEDKESTLNLLEKQWIEKNKNEMIDFGVINNISILNAGTDSLIFDFMDSLESSTGLDFNRISYNYGEEIAQEYAFKVVPTVEDKDILVYSDNYVIVSRDKVKYNTLEEIPTGVVGVISDNVEFVSKILNNKNLSYKSVDSDYMSLISSFNTDDSVFKYIVVPKLLFLSCNDEYEDLYINYNITEMKDNYVISLGSIDKLNDILTKYYKKWSNEEYTNSFNSGFVNTYYQVSNVDEQSKAKFRSKRYIYGFVETSPYDAIINGDLYGINSELIKKFSNITDVEITFKEYQSIESLKKALASNEVDFIFDRFASQEYDMDIYNTVSTSKEKMVVLSKKNNNITINSLYSLLDYDIATLGNTKLEETLTDKVKSLKPYNSIKDLIRDDGIIVIDSLTYNFYKDSELDEFKVDYEFYLDSNYSFLFRDIKNNEVFESFFDFYLTFVNENEHTLNGYNNLVSVTITKDGKKIFIVVVTFIVFTLGAFLLGGRFAPTRKREKKRKINMKKEDKLRYIDMLTSLKNRNYLNDNIEKWDESEAYPQSVVIIDLNNVAYINDNYGHQEGDNVIKEAANILINNQLANSEIIRTNGNEFLLYLVGYDEKAVIAYTKKLSKELKEISHGFGAATGYSMITDGIKTIDDAVNEATLAMRQNKVENN